MRGIILFALIAALFFVGWLWWGDMASAKTSTPTIVVEAVYVVTSTVTPTATPDYTQATMAVVQATADESARQYESYIIGVTQTAEAQQLAQASWAATAEAQRALEVGLTATYQPTADHMAAVQATADVNALALANQQAANMAFAPTATVLIAKAAAEAQFAPVKSAGMTVLVWFAVALIFLFVALIGLRIYDERLRSRREDYEFWNGKSEITVEDQRTIVQTTENNGGYVEVMEFEIPKYVISQEDLVTLARGVIEGGKSLSYGNWVKEREDDGKLMTRTKFSTLVGILRRNKMAQDINPADVRQGVELTDKGVAYFSAILDGEK